MPRLIPPVIPPGSLNGLSQPDLEVDESWYLRQWTRDDVGVVVSAYRDADISWWMPYSYDEAEAAHVIDTWNEDWRQETGACWAMAKRADNSAFGRIAVQNVDFISGSADVAYWVLRESRGEGFAPLALTALCEWAFNQLGLHRMQSLHSVRNRSSCRVADKAGFDLEAVLKSDALYRDGWHDSHLHVRLRPSQF